LLLVARLALFARARQKANLSEQRSIMTKWKLRASVPMLRNLKGAANAARLAHLIAPAVAMCGKTGRDLAEVFRGSEIKDILSGASQLADMPDRFNAHFLKRGWIAYENMNGPLMDTAVQLADAGQVDEAERHLSAHYTAESIQFQLMRMRRISAVRVRESLLDRAFDDYLAERYHACIPLLIAQIDGIVSDLSGHSFFASGRNLIAWDSYSAHEDGLHKLSDILSIPRTKTTFDEIPAPYRHGIAHGRDLGYATQRNAAKCWALLFSLQAWATAKQNRKTAPPEEPSRSLWQVLRERLHREKIERAIRQWQPRTEIAGLGEQSSEDPLDYPETEPERAIVGFLSSWKSRNYGNMASFLPQHKIVNINHEAGRLKHRLIRIELLGFRLQTLEEHGGIGATGTVELRLGPEARVVSTRIVVSCRNVEGDYGLGTMRSYRWAIEERFLDHIHAGNDDAG
jgi:hypothetical protein